MPQPTHKGALALRTRQIHMERFLLLVWGGESRMRCWYD